MQHNKITSPVDIINTDTIINETKVPPNNLNKSVVYPTMFDRWKDF